MTDLIAALLLWIGSLTAYDVDLPHPELVFATRADITRVFYGGDVSQNAEFIEATYDHYRQVIYLPHDWDDDRPTDVAKLLHELVHYVQYRNGRYDEVSCMGQLEPEAYRLQYRWMEEQGIDKEFPAFTVAIRSMCE